MALNEYLNPNFSGSYCQAITNAIQSQFEDSDAILSYMANLTVDNADDTVEDNTTDLAQLGLIMSYPRPIMPAEFNPPASGYLDTATYILLLKAVALAKFNGFSFKYLDYIVYNTLYLGGGITDYWISSSKNGVSSPNADWIINLKGTSSPKWQYVLQAVLDLFLNQGVRVTIIGQERALPFVFAKWNGSTWGDNPLGKGFSRLLTGSRMVDDLGNYLIDDLGNYLVDGGGDLVGEADNEHGGQMLGVI